MLCSEMSGLNLYTAYLFRIYAELTSDVMNTFVLLLHNLPQIHCSPVFIYHHVHRPNLECVLNQIYCNPVFFNRRTDADRHP